jgi:hypothetical protein
VMADTTPGIGVSDQPRHHSTALGAVPTQHDQRGLRGS